MSYPTFRYYKIKFNSVGMLLIALVLIISMAMGGCGTLGLGDTDESGPSDAVQVGDNNLEVEQEPEPEPDIVKNITISAVGDIMGHMPQVDAAYLRDEGTYDFRPNYTSVKPILQASHLMVGNLETTLAGRENRGYTGYPMFNTPDQLADALVWAGFNIISTANNHSLDRFEQGLLRTLDVLEERNLTPVGTARSQDERDRPVIVEPNDIKVGFLAYTYGTNGIPIPQGKNYLVNLIDPVQMEQDITTLRPLVDVVVVCIHWGNEYQREPHQGQRELAQQMVGWGADVIFGSHPHVVQPTEVIRVTREDESLEREGFVIYSLGNFISNQRDRYRDSGLILSVEVEKNFTTDQIAITHVSYIPTWVHKFHYDGKWHFHILPVEEYLAKYGAGHGEFLVEEDYQRLQQVWEETASHLGEIWPEGSNIKISR